MATSRSKLDRIPSYRLHKHSGRGFVELSGKRIYLGPFEDPATRQRYHALIAEWLENGRKLSVDPNQITVMEICARYWHHAQQYYVRSDGSPTQSIDSVKQALRPLKAMYGSTLAVDFGPKALRAIRQVWIDRGLARKTVNDYTASVKRVFKWAASLEFIPAYTYHALNTVEGLRAGRSNARDTAPILPVPEAHIDAVRPYLCRQVNALINLQLLTAARPGELLKLRPIDIDTTGDVWASRLRDHKLAYRQRERILYFGPKAQEILREFVAGRQLTAYLFSPCEAVAERHAKAMGHRRPDQKPTPRKSERTLGDFYTTVSYRKAIVRACDKAGVPAWTPHRLRHSAASRIRRDFDLEAAQHVLGHTHADTTEIYAELSSAKAISIMLEVG